jgi:hypothetical protein
MTDNTTVRLALLESQVKTLIEQMELRDKRAEIRDKKLDELLALKHKGMGAVWLAALIFGSSLVAGLGAVVSWFR